VTDACADRLKSRSESARPPRQLYTQMCRVVDLCSYCAFVVCDVRLATHTRTHTHTHTHTFNGPGLPGRAGTRKAKPVWILLKTFNVRHFIHKMWRTLTWTLYSVLEVTFIFFYLRHFNIDRFTLHYSIVTIDSVASSHPVYSAKN